MRAPLAPPRLSEPRKVAAEAQAVVASSGRQARGQDLGLEVCDVLVVDQVVVDLRKRVLPDQRFFRDFRAEIARPGSHVAVRQLVPGAREGVREFSRVGVEAARDRLVDRVHPQRHVRGGHDRRVLFRRIEGVRDHELLGRILGHPLVCAGGALLQFPFAAEQHVEIAHVPLGRCGGPGAFDAAGDRVPGLAAAMAADPAEAHLLDGRGFGLGADKRRAARAVAFAEGVTAGGKCDGLLVIHRHARERLAHVATRGDRVRVAVRAFGIHVDQAHLHGRQRVLEHTVAGIAAVGLVAGREPFGLGAPVDVFLVLPHVLAPAAETEGLEAHRFHCAVAGEDKQVGPGDLVAVFLLDRPEQSARLVEITIVRPAVERRETLRPGGRAAATVAGAVRAGAMPRHADEEPAVVTKVRWPPVLRVRHQGVKVLFDGLQVELLEFLCVVERAAQRIAGGRVLVKHLEVQLVGPPVAVRPHSEGCGTVHDRAFARRFHIVTVHNMLPSGLAG